MWCQRWMLRINDFTSQELTIGYHPFIEYLPVIWVQRLENWSFWEALREAEEEEDLQQDKVTRSGPLRKRQLSHCKLWGCLRVLEDRNGLHCRSQNTLQSSDTRKNVFEMKIFYCTFFLYLCSNNINERLIDVVECENIIILRQDLSFLLCIFNWVCLKTLKNHVSESYTKINLALAISFCK